MFKKRQQTVQAGLTITHDAIVLVLARRQKQERPVLVEAVREVLGPDVSVRDALEGLNKRFGLSRLPCVCVLEPGEYSLLQMEAPNVAVEELKSALRWKIKDLIDFHVDDATLDLFQMPESSRSGSIDMVNVVVAKSSLIQYLVDICHDTDIEPEAIDITELALRNISRQCMADDDRPAASMYMLPNNVFIEVSDPSALYLSRNIEFSMDDMRNPAPTDTVELGEPAPYANSEYDQLSLEMQRSMDYYESHYGRGPADLMRLLQDAGNGQEFIDFASQQLPFRIESIGLGDHIDGVEHIADDDLPHFIPALGGALRAA